MNNLTISIFGNKIFLEIINELKLFPGSKVNLHDNLNLPINSSSYKSNAKPQPIPWKT